MALSVLQQHLSFADLQSFLDPFPLQRAAAAAIVDLANPAVAFESMEYAADSSNNNNPNHPRIRNTSNKSNSHSTIGDNGGHQSGGGAENSFPSGNINQHLNSLTRTYISGYHHQHISHDYEPVINFVDSPPNSEGSWTGNEEAKASPGPQIIDVQTLYSNSATRKRRMDWDSLDIGQGGNTASAHSTDNSNKNPHLGGNSTEEHHNNQQLNKEKHKKEKLSGRGSWTDDIDFDLNAEFSSNSYLNNESFLSFSTALTVLKQEPQTDPSRDNKSPTRYAPKVGKPTHDSVINSAHKTSSKHDLSEAGRGCGSAPTAAPESEHNPRAEKPGSAVTATGHDNLDVFSVENSNSRVLTAGKLSAESPTIATPLSDDHKFQYILAAATSIATKNNEETLTYLNQGQSYEIKLKKAGDLSFYRDKILKSVIKICFHERRLQYMEREQMQQWQAARPGERIIEVDVPLSYGLCHVSQPLHSNCLNTVEVFWDPLKEVGVYVKVNCISTEFTPKKHGGEKGVPFRLQIETYIENTPTPTAAPAAASIGGQLSPTANPNAQQQGVASKAVHGAACQIKVFKLKGADRKHKQDREKIQKRPQSEHGKFQPSYECTIMNDISLDLIAPATGCFSPEYMKVWPNSPVQVPKYDGVLPYASSSPAANASPVAINSVTSSNSPTLKLMDANVVSPQQAPSLDIDDYSSHIMPDATPAQVMQWLTYHRLTAYLSTFAHFSGSDILRMSKEDLIQICGLADGIRMFNILRAKVIAPRLTIYVSMDSSSYNAIYLLSSTARELSQKLFKLPGFYELIASSASLSGSAPGENGSVYSPWPGMQAKYSGSSSNIFSDVSKVPIYVAGPSGVHVNVTDEVLNNEIKDGSLYALEMQNGKIIMKIINKNDN